MILERPGTISPILIHGPCGSGKSHLAKAAAQQLRRRCGFRRTILMTAEQFTIDYTESARGAGFASFRKKYRDVDAFVLDDLQFCLGKSATLSELRNTLDNLIRDRKQVIFVSDRSLNELTGLGSDLIARIAGGMSCGMEPLDADTRLSLLKRLLAKHELELSTSTVESLAESAGGDGVFSMGLYFVCLPSSVDSIASFRMRRPSPLVWILFAPVSQSFDCPILRGWSAKIFVWSQRAFRRKEKRSL